MPIKLILISEVPSPTSNKCLVKACKSSRTLCDPHYLPPTQQVHGQTNSFIQSHCSIHLLLLFYNAIPLKLHHHYYLVSCNYITPLLYALVPHSMVPLLFHQNSLSIPTIPTPMGICTFRHFINKYGYYIIRQHFSFYIVKIRLPKLKKIYINFNITLIHKVKLTLHPLAYLDMPITPHNTTFYTHTQTTQTFSQHMHTCKHNSTTHYTHLLILLLTPYSMILTSRFYILVLPSFMKICTLYCYTNQINYYIIHKHHTSYTKNNMPSKFNTNSIPSNTTLKAKHTPSHTNLDQLTTHNNTTPPLHTYTTSKTLELYTHTYNAHFPQTNTTYLPQCLTTTTHPHNTPKTNLPPPQPTPHIIITTPTLNNINNYLTYINHNTQGNITKLQNKQHPTTTYKV